MQFSDPVEIPPNWALCSSVWMIYCFSQGLLQLCHFRAKGAGSVKGEDLDDEESADEGDDGDFTVYECPGLAPVS